MSDAPSLDALARLAAGHLAAATPGPWRVEHGRTYDTTTGAVASTEAFVRRPDDDVAIAADIVDPATGLHSDANAALIAAAPDLARGLVAAVDALRAAEAQRDALAAAVREERDAADAYDAACAALDSDACAVASVRMDAATTATDALLSGCAADVVRAGVVRDHLAALDLLTTTRVDDTTPEMRGNAVATRTALDAALAAAEGRS